jgi:uncharacterized protein
MLAFCFGVISLLYSTVGQAGGTAFLALMAFASFPPREMRPTALLLNIIAATYSTLVFSRGKHIDWSKLKILLISSLPAAFAGGFIALDERIYRSVAGVVLLLAAIIVVFRRSGSLGADHAAPLSGSIVVGAGTGFVSGLTGVGGGVFLAPILIGLHWASPKQTSAMSAPFILANSFVGLIGALFVGQAPAHYTWLYAIAALAGSMVGTVLGLRWLSQAATRVILTAILATAGLQLLL